MEFLNFIEERFPYPSIREQQKRMMLKIYFSILNNRNLIIEAPTGVGKTLGYLIPSIYFAERGKRVAILTETIDQQLRIYEELNSLKHNLKVSFFMGKGNYFCKAKGSKANRIYCQLNRKCKFRPNKKKICSICNSPKKEINLGDKTVYLCPLCCCDYQLSKINSIFADIVVMNNHIFFYAKEELESLKKFDVIIVDEAHKLEDSIRRAYSIEINPNKVINRLKYMAYYYAPTAFKRRLDLEDEKFWEMIERYLNNIGLDYTLKRDLDNFNKNYILGIIFNCYTQILEIKNKILELNENEELPPINFYFDCKEIIDIELDFIEKKNLDPVLAEFIENLDYLKFANINFVRYRSKESLICEPIFVNSALKELYGDSVVIHCSATIGNLKMHAIKTGMENSDFLVLDSPFPKDRKMIIGLEDGVNMKYELKNRDEANKNLIKIIEAINGNILVLFRSFEDLDNFYKYLKKEINNLNIENKNIHVYEQSMDGKEAKELKDRFIREGGILLATGRFAEGVDIPGEALIGVIIDSLPFPIPTPLIIKEQKILEEKYGQWKAFLMTSFDRMARTLIQMIGRLIRTENDYGVVVIQDKRFSEWVGRTLKKEGYLKDNYKILSLDESIREIKNFLNKFRVKG
ncbi:ATP-dependent DNA helicase [Methanocaldococcus indicus]|uniref:ATP-dependent DNA helicase n=1 Tax=Methanocaldococcus indicus TaxID=213231 RepID=UPI003C6D5141